MDNFDRRKENLKRVLTCGICKKLYKNVTIIEECCHRFCKKCITKKIIEEKLKVCPECNQDLGVAPLQKIRPDHQMQGIRDVLSRKRREFIERGLIQKSKKGEPKKLAWEDIDLNNSADMLIDNSPSPPSLSPLAPVVATSLRRKQKSIASLVNTTPLVVDDQVLSQQNVWSSSTGRGRGRGRERGRGRRKINSLSDANDVHLQNSSKFNEVIDLNNEDMQPESSTMPLLSGKDSTQHKQQVKSSVGYAVESSKKNKSIDPLKWMNDLWKPSNKLAIKGVTLDNSNKLSKAKEPVPKFIKTSLINLDDYEDVDYDDEEEEEDEEYVPSPKFKEHKVSKKNVVQKLVVVQAIEAPSISNSNNTDKGKGKKGRRGRKKKETNNPVPALTPTAVPALTPTAVPAPAPALAPAGSNGDGRTTVNVAQVGVTTELVGGTSSGSTGALNQRVHPIWFNLVACDKQECPSPLPQISSCYIKIKDVNIPASYIKKYLAHKLGLQNEDEVEIRMLEMSICPFLPLKHLAELWLRAPPNSEKKLAKVGASAQEFVMILKYSRSHP